MAGQGWGGGLHAGGRERACLLKIHLSQCPHVSGEDRHQSPGGDVVSNEGRKEGMSCSPFWDDWPDLYLKLFSTSLVSGPGQCQNEDRRQEF